MRGLEFVQGFSDFQDELQPHFLQALIIMKGFVVEKERFNFFEFLMDLFSVVFDIRNHIELLPIKGSKSVNDFVIASV